MSSSNKNNLNLLLISLFIILSISIYLILEYEKKMRIEEYLEKKTTMYTQNYTILYNHHKKISQLIFDTKINTTETKDILSLTDTLGKNISRDLLHTHLLQEYERLKKHKLKQLHFHLSNNESFLRFHRPLKFGDNLTSSRESVNYVNTTKKKIDGFEEGRIYNGYRFVYPLKQKEQYLGSVEISFSTLAMAIDLMDNYDVTANFLILKKIVDKKLFENEKNNYMNSKFDEFYMETQTFDYIKSINKHQNNIAISAKTKEAVSEFFNSNEEQSSIFSKNLKKVLTLIKLKNPVTNKAVGIFIIKSDAKYIYNKTKNFYISLILSILFMILALLFIKKELTYRAQIKQDHKEIERLNGNLQDEIDEAVENLRVQETLLAQKSKMAAMGEMIDSIAHQWIQPISIIKLKLQVLEMDTKDNDPLKNKLRQTLDDCYKQIQHLTDTIQEFRIFFRPTTQKQTMTFQVLIDSALILIQDELIKNTISVSTTGDTDTTVDVTGNEFKHVIINLINNSKDAFIENKIENRQINFHVEAKHQMIILTISDNAGGVPQDIIGNIFEANFTTKGKDQGTGIGLYMSKQIIEKMDAKISVSNLNDGASFKIEIPSDNLI